MSEYFFVVDTGNAPIYQLSEELCDAAPTNVFTYPNKSITMEVQYKLDGNYDVPDAFDMPNFSIKKNLFEKTNLSNIFGVNWLDVTVNDKGMHDFSMLQVANEVKIIDRNVSNIKYYRIDDDGDEMIEGIYSLVLNDKLIGSIPVSKRLVVVDPAWFKYVFFHETIVREIESLSPSGISFIPAQGYSDF